MLYGYLSLVPVIRGASKLGQPIMLEFALRWIKDGTIGNNDIA